MYKFEEAEYKSSEVSRILNITTDTLRYFEKAGIITPKINPANNYRYYDHWDINALLDYKMLRSLELSMADAIKMEQSDDLSAYTDRIKKQLAYFSNRQLYYTYAEECLREKAEILASIPQKLGRVEVCEMEAMDYFVHRYSYSYERHSKFEGVYDDWMDKAVFIYALFLMPRSDIKDWNHNFDGGFSVSSRMAELLGFKLDKNVYHIPDTRAICIVERAGDKGTFSYELFKPALRYIHDNRLEIRGEHVFGHLLARVHEEDGYARYIRFFIPVM